ncbi:MAG: hypothetical protein ACTTHG_06985 [Treponemataceae bacterium]
MRQNFIVFLFALLFLTDVSAQSSISSSISSLKSELLKIEEDHAVIQLKWEVPEKNNITSFLIYRDTQKITKDTITSLKPITTLTGRYTKYTDTVYDLSKSYFYCVLTDTENSGIFGIIIPAVNSTVAAVIPNEHKIDILQYINEAGRIKTVENERELTPLPYLNELSNSKNTIVIPQKYLKLAQNFSKTSKSKNTKKIQILDIDKKAENGDQYLLSLIVNGSFKEAKWDEASKELEDFLRVNRSQETVNRAHFYQGQIFYYKGDSRKAIFSFMKSQNDYPIESRQWIDEVLNKIE